MFKTQIEIIKSTEYSNTFISWISTLLFLPLAFYFRFVIGTSLVLYKNLSAYTQTAWILGLVFLLWLIWKWLFDDHLITTGLEKYLLAFFIAACLSTAFSDSPGMSLERMVGISTYILSIYLLLDLKRSPHLWQGIINALLITAGLSSLLILISAYPSVKLYQITPYQILIDPAYLLKILPRLPYSLRLHQSVTAGFLVMILPLGLYQFLRSKKTIWKVLQAAGLALNLFVLLLTQSRGGLLGILFLFITLVIISWRKIWDLFIQDKILASIIILIFTVIGFGYVSLLGGSRGFDLNSSNIQDRFHLWEVALKIIQDNPLLGSGLGTFGQKYLELRNPGISSHPYIHAHNQLIQLTAELGILGIITLLLLFWQIFRRNQQETGQLPLNSQMAVIALGGLFGVELVDAIFTSSMIVILFIFYFVILIPGRNDRPLPNKGRLFGGLTLVIILVGVGYGWNIWKIKPYDRALKAAWQNNWEGASSALLTAQERDPSNPYYNHALGFSLGQVACQVGKGADEALTYYNQSFETYPNWGIDHANAGDLYAFSGDFQNAVLQMEQAVHNYPQESFFYCLLGDYYLQLDKSQEAVQSYSRCISDKPQYLDSPYWQEDQNKEEFTHLVIDQAEILLRDREDDNHLIQLASLFLITKEPEKAKQIIQEFLDQHPNDLTGNLVSFEILESNGTLSSATERINQLSLIYPRNAQLWIYQGILALESSDNKTAEENFTIGYRLSASSNNAWILGSFYQSQGDLQKSLEIYQTALYQYIPLDAFSQNVAGRFPLPGVYIDCFPKVMTFTGYINPGLEAAQDLAERDCQQAACLLQALFKQFPTNQDVRNQLEELPCAGDYSESQCFYNDIN